MEGYEFYKQIREIMSEDFVDHREGNMPGAGDLYIKKTAESKELVKQYDFPSNVSTFKSQTEPFDIWYEIFGGWCEKYEARYQKLQIESLRAEKEMLKEKNEHLLDRLRYETITAEGSLIRATTFGKCCSFWEINTSSILTKLIQEAGRWCESYASDLFIRWGAIQNCLETASVEPGRCVFAFRESGVDGVREYMIHDDAYGYYRAVWILDVSISEDKITMQLKKKI